MSIYGKHSVASDAVQAHQNSCQLADPLFRLASAEVPN